MKKMLLILLTIFIVTLSACTAPSNEESKAKDIANDLKNQETEETPTEDTVTEETTTEETTEQTQPTQEQETSNLITGDVVSEITTPEEITNLDVQEETVNPPQLRTKMYKFLDTYAQRVNGYDFFLGINKYSYKNDRFRIILSKAPQVSAVTFGELKKSVFYYDTIYVDRVSKTAFGYCEGHEETVNRQCAELEIYDLAYPLPYSELNIALPHDWLFRYLEREPDTMDANKYYVKGRASTTVRFEDDPRVELHIDPGTGLPMRVDTLRGSVLLNRVDFEKLASNTVRDVDVYHRTRSEIPSSEAFYQ